MSDKRNNMGKEMNKPRAQAVLESVFTGAVDKLSKADNGQLTEALFVQLDMATGEVQVYDDHELLLEKNIIFEWAEHPEKNRQAVHFIRVALAALKTRRTFDNPIFARPFKVLITDDSFDEIETVLTLENAEGVSEGRLMKNLEQDLQIFFKKLFVD